MTDQKTMGALFNAPTGKVTFKMFPAVDDQTGTVLLGEIKNGKRKFQLQILGQKICSGVLSKDDKGYDVELAE